MDFLRNHIESLIFCSQEPISIDEIHQCMEEMFDAKVPVEDIENEIENLTEKYKNDEYSYEILKIAGGYQFLTKPAYQASIAILLKQKSKRRLSTSAMETLAIIAYKQPMTKTEVENIRGVNCDYSIQKLLEKELLEIKGKSDGVGRPILYGTSGKFMEYFGINSLEELPLPKDFRVEENEIGEKQSIEVEKKELTEETDKAQINLELQSEDSPDTENQDELPQITPEEAQDNSITKSDDEAIEQDMESDSEDESEKE